MKIYRTIEEIDERGFRAGSVVATGKFDGVHRGHKVLLSRATEEAERLGVESVAFTFVNHPLSLLNPEACPPSIMSPEQRLEAIAEAGVDHCVMVRFDERFAGLDAEEFVHRVLVERLHARHLCVGPDFRFGHRGEGDVGKLIGFGERYGFTVETIPIVEDEALGRVSSSRIREEILEGDVVTAARMMDRPVQVRGEVVRGDARGRELGFPTANLGGAVEGLIPAEGVYAGWVVLGEDRHHAAISVGNNPTFTPEARTRVEAHLLDFEGDLYGEVITVEFAERLRGNVVFSGVDALIERMGEDVSQARRILLGR